MKGSTYKRCRCQRDGVELGAKCPQVRRADGSWNPRHGSWFFRVELEPDADGNRRVLRRGGFPTQKGALAALDAARGKAARGVDVTRRLTVAAYLTEWLTGKRDIRPSTLHSYRQHVADYFTPHLGRIEIALLRRGHVEAMFAAIDAERAQTDTRPMGAATKQRVRATLRSALADAEREGLITTNAARLARLETGKRPKVRPLEPAELGKLLDHLAGDPLGAFFETVAATGLRRGEALALRWSDFDLERGRLVVRQQLAQMGGAHPCPYCAGGHRGMRFGKLKTASGEARLVELDGGTVGVLPAHKLA